MRLNRITVRPFMMSGLVVGLLLGGCGGEPPSRDEVVAETTQSLTDAINDYGAALEELMDHEALKPFFEMFESQGVVRVGLSHTDDPPEDTGDMIVIDNDFKSDAKEAAEAIAEHLKTKVFTDKAVESTDGDTVTFLLDAKALCFGDDDSPQVPEKTPVPGPRPDDAPPVPDKRDSDQSPPRPEQPEARAESSCTDEIPVEIRIDAKKIADGIELGLRIDKGGHIAVVRFEKRRISLTIDLAEVKVAYDSFAAQSKDTPDAKLLKATGKLELALDRPVVGDRRATISVVEAIEAEVEMDGSERVTVKVGKVSPLVSARITADEVDLDVDTAGVSIAVPLSTIFDLKNGVTPPTSLFSLVKGSFSFQLRKDQLVSLKVGGSEARWELGSDVIIKAVSAAASTNCTRVVGADRARCTFDPGADGSLTLAMSKLEAFVEETFDSVVNDVYAAKLTGNAPEVEVGEGPSDVLLKVITGTLSLSQKNAAHQVTVNAGQCLMESDATDRTGIAYFMAGTCN